jgi:hypothetical protein
MLHEHLGRIEALAIRKGFCGAQTADQIENAVYRTLAVNDVRDNVLIRIVHEDRGVIVSIDDPPTANHELLGRCMSPTDASDEADSSVAQRLQIGAAGEVANAHEIGLCVVLG